jgi:hypothetical protein
VPVADFFLLSMQFAEQQITTREGITMWTGGLGSIMTQDVQVDHGILANLLKQRKPFLQTSTSINFIKISLLFRLLSIYPACISVSMMHLCIHLCICIFFLYLYLYLSIYLLSTTFILHMHIAMQPHYPGSTVGRYCRLDTILETTELCSFPMHPHE